MSTWLQEMRALNLKLNADRLDAQITDYFDTVIFLNNANWNKDRIASFLDKSVGWIEEIIRFVPGMDPRLRGLLGKGQVTWSKAKLICRQVLDAEPGQEKATADRLLAELSGGAPAPAARKPLSVKKAVRRLTKHMEANPKASYTIDAEDLFALLMLLDGGGSEEKYMERVRRKFPALLD